MEENERDDETIIVNGKKLNVVLYTTIHATGSFVEIFDLRDAEGIRLGWSHLVHLSKEENDKKSIITELFVWPTFRRRGYGSILESYCTNYAQRMGSTFIEAPLYDMDDLKGAKSPARFFGNKHGYKIIEQKQVLPCTNATFNKNL
jgi:GNAT superfamily N-acetyltransferase